MNDLIASGQNPIEAMQMKTTTAKVFTNAAFELHKWNFNVPALESSSQVEGEETETFAKQPLGATKCESSILRLPWNKREDTIGLKFRIEFTKSTKRGILGKINRFPDLWE